MRRLTLPRRFLFGMLLLVAGLLPPATQATPPTQTSSATTVLLVPFGASGAADKVWAYRHSSWAGLTPPVPSMYWLWIAADPVNPHRWLMLGNSIPSNEQFVFAGGQVRMRDGATPPLWFTDTAGSSWRPVPLLDSPALTYRFDTVEFDTTQPGSWFLAGLRDTSTSRTGALWRGAATSSGEPLLLPTLPDPRHLSPGQNGDVVLAADNEGASRFGYVAGGSTVGIVTGTSYQLMIDRLPGLSRAVVGVDRNGGALQATPDYRTGGPTARTSEAVGGVVTAAQDGVYVGRRCCGLLRIIDPFGVAAREIVVGEGFNIGFVRADRQTRTAVAALQSTNFRTLYLRAGTGAAWTTITTPSQEIANRLEVIVSAQAPAPTATPLPTRTPFPTTPPTPPASCPVRAQSVESTGLPPRQAIAPPATTSRYIVTTRSRTLFNYGCKAAQDGERGIAVLFFGAPAYDAPNRRYGTRLLDDQATFVSVHQIAVAAKAWTDGFWRFSRPGQRIILAIGTKNQGLTPQFSRGHGAAWGRDVVNLVAANVRSKGYASRITVVGASNIELNWNTPAITKDWIAGYTSTSRAVYYTVGDCSGCPHRERPGWSPDNGWTLEDIWFVSWLPRPARPFPQIYNTRGVGAWQWQNVARWARQPENKASNMEFLGAFTQFQACKDRADPCDGENNTPAQGWRFFTDALNSDPKTRQSLSWSSDVRWNFQ